MIILKRVNIRRRIINVCVRGNYNFVRGIFRNRFFRHLLLANFPTEETAYVIKCAENGFPFRNVLTRKFLKCYNESRGTADWRIVIMDEPPQLELSTDKGQKIWRVLCLRRAN